MGTSHVSGPVRYSNSNEDPLRRAFKDMFYGIDPDMFKIWDDFIMVDDDQTNDWTVVKDSSASVGIVADAVGGQLIITSNTTTDDDGGSIQGNEVFLPADGKDIWFEGRV